MTENRQEGLKSLKNIGKNVNARNKVTGKS